jgi:hypothetical protein
MNKYLSIVLAGLLIAAGSYGESAHKGWTTATARWSFDPSPDAVIRSVGMAGPSADIRQPDPPTNGIFQAGYEYRVGSTVNVLRVYMLIPNVDGTIETKEIKTTAPIKLEREVVSGYYSASFNTEKVTFKEGDVFVMVLKVDGRILTQFLKIHYDPFVPH